jgi:hypothetical protein
VQIIWKREKLHFSRAGEFCRLLGLGGT